MRKPRLTDKALWPDGRLAHRYEYEGGSVVVHDSAFNALLVIDLLQDQTVPEDDKVAILLQLVFAHPEEIVPEAVLATLDAVLWDMAGIDLLGTRESDSDGPQAFDWEEDATRIKASLLMAYGLEWEEASRKLTFAELCDLLGMLVGAEGKTPFAEAVYYRTAQPPKLDGHNREYVEAWKANQRRYRLHTEAAVSEERKREDAMASAAFDSLWKAAQNG